ncbi:MAG: hypothetical protein AB1545_15185 [Thermodesulfobacteriota bacterium]
MLEQEVVPAFYNRDERGIPTAWVARMRESMARLTTRFSCNRMAREYIDDCYLPAAEAYRRRAVDHTSLAVDLEKWHNALAIIWPYLLSHESAGNILLRVDVHLIWTGAGKGAC